jgi:FMN reductase
MRVAVVVGNPKPKSRTHDAGVLVARTLAGKDPDLVLDLIELGPALLQFGNADVERAVQSVRQCDVAVFASPTYKATYTGLLKLFLDQFPSDGLAGVIGIPLMLGAGPAHAMAPDLLLKPVLVELGATCPMPGLYLIDKTFAEDPRLDTRHDSWATRARMWIGPVQERRRA